MAYLLGFLTVTLEKQKLMKSIFSAFFLVVFVFYILFKKSLLNTVTNMFCVFLQKFNHFSSMSVISLELSFVHDVRSGAKFIFSHRYLVIQALFLEKIIFSFSSNCLDTFAKINCPYILDLFMDSQFCSIDLYIYIHANTILS